MTAAATPQRRPHAGPRVWENLTDGRLACDQHLGHYATSQLRADPNRRVLDTPLGVWMPMSADAYSEWEAELGEPPRCEQCRYGS